MYTLGFDKKEMANEEAVQEEREEEAAIAQEQRMIFGHLYKSVISDLRSNRSRLARRAVGTWCLSFARWCRGREWCHWTCSARIVKFGSLHGFNW